MSIDYSIDYGCVPKEELSPSHLLTLLKNRERAQQVIQVYRDAGDDRPENEIGFELTRRTSDGSQETELFIAADLLQEAARLDPLAHHCADCPARLTAQPFSCFGSINYPISREAEIWLLEQLPGIDEPLLFLMLIRGIQEIGYTGQAARALRDQEGIYFANPDTMARHYAEMDVTADILFEMTFQLGPIQPAHGAMLLLFYHAIPRASLEPPDVMALTRQEIEPDDFARQYPFLHEVERGDQSSTLDLKRFLKALYIAYKLNVTVSLDL